MTALSRNTDPATSHLAANKHNKGRTKTNLQIVYSIVEDNPGLTYREIAKKQRELEPVEVMRRLNSKKFEKQASRKCSVSGTLCTTWRLS